MGHSCIGMRNNEYSPIHGTVLWLTIRHTSNGVLWRTTETYTYRPSRCGVSDWRYRNHHQLCDGGPDALHACNPEVNTMCGKKPKHKVKGENMTKNKKERGYLIPNQRKCLSELRSEYPFYYPVTKECHNCGYESIILVKKGIPVKAITSLKCPLCECKY